MNSFIKITVFPHLFDDFDKNKHKHTHMVCHTHKEKCRHCSIQIFQKHLEDREVYIFMWRNILVNQNDDEQ